MLKVVLALTDFVTKFVASSSIAWVAFAGHCSFGESVVHRALGILSTGLKFDTRVNTLLVNTGLSARTVTVTFAGVIRD